MIATIEFALHTVGDVTLIIYDLRGASVRRLIDRSVDAGRHFVEWDGKSDDGKVSPAGLYTYRLFHSSMRRAGTVYLTSDNDIQQHDVDDRNAINKS